MNVSLFNPACLYSTYCWCLRTSLTEPSCLSLNIWWKYLTKHSSVPNRSHNVDLNSKSFQNCLAFKRGTAVKGSFENGNGSHSSHLKHLKSCGVHLGFVLCLCLTQAILSNAVCSALPCFLLLFTCKLL